MSGYSVTRYLVVGDRGISVEFGNSLDEELNLKVQKMMRALEQAALPGIIETNPTIRSLFVCYDPLRTGAKELVREMRKIERRMADIRLPEPRVFEIPVLYGGEHGPDLEEVAGLLRLTPEDFVRIHSGREYFIYDTGFIGGSAHFKVPPPLDSLPRKKTPNLGVPAGAVLIAGGLGSVFKPLAGPTGWYWVGTSPLRQWFPEKDPPLLILPGDRIFYRPVDREEFDRIKKMVEEGKFTARLSPSPPPLPPQRGEREGRGRIENHFCKAPMQGGEMPKSTSLERYATKFPRSKEMFSRAEQMVPRGVAHDAWQASPFPLFMTRAAGSRIWDVDGNEFIDYFGGHGGKVLGHAHPAVVRAAQAQLERGIQFGTNCDLMLEWAGIIQRLVPSAERIEFMNSGTEAIMYGIRLARAYTGRKKVIRFQFHFAGAYDAVTVGYKKPFQVSVSAGVLPEAVEDTIVLPMNEEKTLEEALRNRDVAVVMVEAAGASSGVVGIKPSFYRTMRDLTGQYGTLLLFDEIVTGFRYSPGGVQAAVGVTPDLTTLGKGITGVMPGAGAVVGKREVLEMLLFKDEEWNRYRRVSHFGTFNANPLCAASGIAYLNVIASGRPTEEANRNARVLRDGMQAQLDRREIPGCVYDSNFSVVHVYLGTCGLRGKCDRGVCVNAEKERPSEVGEALYRNFALNGVKTAARGFDLFVSAVHSEEDLERTIRAFGNCLDTMLEEKTLK